MAPSAKALREALIDGTCDVFKLEPDTTSVNKVRNHVEEKLGLGEGFFSNEDWKQKSKQIIKEYVGKLLDGWTPQDKKDNPVKSKAAAKKKSTPTGSDDDGERARNPSSPDRKRKRAAANTAEDGGQDEVLETPSKKAKSESKSPDPVIDEEEEYSDVIDEPPTSKRKKTNKEPGQKATKGAKSAKPSTKKKSSGSGSVAEPSDPQEAEIKKLQGQLAKCGVRKLWHNELKGCHDARAKIRHLREMLAEVGMEGRFSEAKAREIKETRELLADAEAAQEMNRLWGMDAGGRKSRNKSRGAKIVESEGSGEEENGDDGEGDGEDGTGHGQKNGEEDEDVSFAARRRRAHADLAFLGDDTDSD